MLSRRQFLERTLKGSSLVALGSTVPGFVAAAARAATPGQDTVLVVVEMTGGNDGLNTVVPYADDLYHKARPAIGLRKPDLVRLDDHVGLNPGVRSFEKLLAKGQLAVVQGVGYPNPNRSHFESMDVWQSADPRAKVASGWLGRGLSLLGPAEERIPGVHIGQNSLPLALRGSSTGVPTIHPARPFDLRLGGESQGGRTPPPPAPGGKDAKPAGPREMTAEEKHRAARRKLIQELAEEPSPASANLLPFVRRSALQTYASIDCLREITGGGRDDSFRFYFGEVGPNPQELSQNLNLVGKMIQAGLGTRIFYVAQGGYDTHSGQRNQHERLLREMAGAVTAFFGQLEQSGHARRVVLMTFSEFGRRVQENASAGTDHGAASCLFVAGPAVKGGVVGRHPSLADLDDGDLKFHTDFRRIYAALLDDWLGCDSRSVLGGAFAPLALVRKG